MPTSPATSASDVGRVLEFEHDGSDVLVDEPGRRLGFTDEKGVDDASVVAVGPVQATRRPEPAVERHEVRLAELRYVGGRTNGRAGQRGRLERA
ncbi:hypothetical protein [Streptomyces sp. NPDC091294]|uniref:hypothetical protein n=1 Tax=Streptomyces sp. NPDC091294 TaxID=3365992 RepID=UPI00381FF705